MGTIALDVSLGTFRLGHFAQYFSSANFDLGALSGKLYLEWWLSLGVLRATTSTQDSYLVWWLSLGVLSATTSTQDS